MRRCSPKRRFKTKLDAQLAMANIGKKDKRPLIGKRERRIYECPECGGWHLTSRARWNG